MKDEDDEVPCNLKDDWADEIHNAVTTAMNSTNTIQVYDIGMWKRNYLKIKISLIQ